ncbi:hypothetical protein HK096_003622 [Nowakowskiella sp. JEL0078]|nr:hypothetical protein HK096_003622 [Nowakowskiella sp. JEL0078]
MYGFGDVPNPAQDSAELMEDILLDFINDLCISASRSSQTTKVQTRDFLHALRKDPKKLARARELVVLDKQLQDARKTFNVDEMAVVENLETDIGGQLPPQVNSGTSNGATSSFPSVTSTNTHPLQSRPLFPSNSFRPSGIGGNQGPVIHLPGGQIAPGTPAKHWTH